MPLFNKKNGMDDDHFPSLRGVINKLYPLFLFLFFVFFFAILVVVIVVEIVVAVIFILLYIYSYCCFMAAG